MITKGRISEENAARRLFTARKGENRAIGTVTAEPLLMSVDLDCHQIDGIAQLPGGKEAALEMVECHFEFGADERPTDFEVKQLARQLIGFTRGYLAGVNSDITTDTEEWAKLVAGYRLDRYNRTTPDTFNVERRQPEPDAA